ncbi:hypothetical protein Taro_048835 [Colocasia esculenta]|uniref:Uncharacterized protein n=1 Tax=Colocasia esculenta TaxID=4460 RepID=A0A843X993_COLES|nr:hypothetical protein [Colocasia esculenta]
MASRGRRAERRPERMSRDVRSRRSSRPQHRKVLYFPHRCLWIMEYSCKVWCNPCRRKLILRQHSGHSWRLSSSTSSGPWWTFYHGKIQEDAATLF